LAALTRRIVDIVKLPLPYGKITMPRAAKTPKTTKTTKAVKPAKAAAATKAVKPVKAAAATKTGKPAKAAAATKTSKPAKAAAVTKTSKPAKAATATKTVKPAKAAAATKTVKPAKGAKGAKAATATKTVKRPKAPKNSVGLEFNNFEPYKPKRGEKYMNEQQRVHFKTILLNWKSDLMQEVDRTVNHMKDEAANFPDPADRATQEEEFSLELRTRDRERKLIKKIDSTMELIDVDDYGYCEACGVDIGIKRLEARPTATQCIDCKTLAEIKEKQEMG
jgi:DnaK suppressor protein